MTLLFNESLGPALEPGLAAYGGVFTKTSGAWRNPVYISEDAAGNTKIVVDKDFNQKMSQYTCAHLLMFSPQSRTMYTSWFGGISLYYFDQTGKLVESNLDNFMPFVNTITTFARLRTGRTLEWPQPPAQALPALLGANAVLILRPGMSIIQNHILNSDRISGKTLVGYLYGGIHAMGPQISFVNPSYADSTIYEVYVEKIPAAKGKTAKSKPAIN